MISFPKLKSLIRKGMIIVLVLLSGLWGGYVVYHAVAVKLKRLQVEQDYNQGVADAIRAREQGTLSKEWTFLKPGLVRIHMGIDPEVSSADGQLRSAAYVNGFYAMVQNEKYGNTDQRQGPEMEFISQDRLTVRVRTDFNFNRKTERTTEELVGLFVPDFSRYMAEKLIRDTGGEGWLRNDIEREFSEPWVEKMKSEIPELAKIKFQFIDISDSRLSRPE